jgi:hypothetical protein
MSINNKEVAPTFLEYSFDTDGPQQGSISYTIGTESDDPEVKDRFKKFRIRTQSKSGNSRNISIDLNLQDLTDIADAVDQDVEIKLRTLKVCQGGKEKNIVVLCSNAFENPE